MRKRYRKLSLTDKLSVLIIVAMIFTFTAIGIYFDGFLKQSYQETTKKQMLHGFEKLANDEKKIEEVLKKGVDFIENDEEMLASVDLINNYQDKEHYNAILLDEEKKILLEELLAQVQLSFNDDIALYDQNEELIAFITKEEAGYLLQFISYENGEQLLFSRYQHEALYRREPFHEHGLLQFKHKAFYKRDELIHGKPITYHFYNNALTIKSHKSLFDPVTGRVMAHLEMTHVFDSSYFETLSNDIGMNVALSQDSAYAPLAVSLHDEACSEKFEIAQNDDAYVGVMMIESNDGPLYFVATLDKAALQHVLESNRRQFLILLVTLAAVILLLLRHLFQRGLAHPLERLMQQIAKIESHDYTPVEPLETGDELQAVSNNISRLAATVREREEELEHLSTHDPLTALPNHRLFSQRLKHAMEVSQRNGTKAALLFLDIDQFKQVNDTLGHNVGDELLQQAAKRLLESLRRSDTLARIGGDEFNILIENVEDLSTVETVVRKLHADFQRPYHCSGHEINTTISIGIAFYPDDGLDSVTLIKHADLAMYKSKDSGRNSYSFFSQELSMLLSERTEKTRALKAAIDTGGEFILLYQPKVSLKHYRVNGIEALIRWNSPKYGFVRPDQFITLAEETGLIIPIGEWVLHRACSDFVALQKQGCHMDHVSINVSGVQLRNSDMIATLQRTIAATGIPAHQVELEITESYIATEGEAALKTLRKFRDMGIKLAVDDFGTGYSSMSYLKQLPITRLKIDKSFIDGLPSDPEDVAIANAIIALAKSFNLSITAEGVETVEQVAFLDAGHCDEAQGYLYAKPLELDALKTFYETLEPL